MQHRHMVYGELYIHHCLFLDQNENYNAYSNPLAPLGLECGPQNGNAGNWFVLQYIFTYLCAASALS